MTSQVRTLWRHVVSWEEFVGCVIGRVVVRSDVNGLTIRELRGLEGSAVLALSQLSARALALDRNDWKFAGDRWPSACLNWLAVFWRLLRSSQSFLNCRSRGFLVVLGFGPCVLATVCAASWRNFRASSTEVIMAVVRSCWRLVECVMDCS